MEGDLLALTGDLVALDGDLLKQGGRGRVALRSLLLGCPLLRPVRRLPVLFLFVFELVRAQLKKVQLKYLAVGPRLEIKLRDDVSVRTDDRVGLKHARFLRCLRPHIGFGPANSVLKRLN